MHRSIVAVDIEGSTQRTNPIRGELRKDVYRLTAGALDMAEIDDQYCDPFIRPRRWTTGSAAAHGRLPQAVPAQPSDARPRHDASLPRPSRSITIGAEPGPFVATRRSC